MGFEIAMPNVRMQRKYRRLIAVLMLLGTAQLALAQDLVFIGHATDLDSDRLLYVETHRVQLDASAQYQEAEVQYRDAEGELIALKKLDYRPHVLRPQLAFEDKRDGSRLRVENQNARIALETEQGKQKSRDIVRFSREDLVIVDAGFDRMVRKYWQNLLDGETIYFEFLALSRSSLVSFKLLQKSLDSGHMELAIVPTNWLVNMLMDPIELRYERDSKRLMEYRGVTNIRAWEQGKLSEDNYHARIRYEYRPVAETASVPVAFKERHEEGL